MAAIVNVWFCNNMSAKWSTEVLGGGGVDFADLLKDEYAVLLLRGKNVFGDFIFCYLKVGIQQFKALQAALQGDANFVISDYGSVLAAGKGEPPEEVKAEISLSYPATKKYPPIHSGANAPPPPPEKKNWDEY